MKWLLGLILRIIYPPYCCNCERFGTYLCDDCQYYVDFHFVPIRKPKASFFDSVHAAFTMSGPISQMIHCMKYKSVIGIAELFGKLLYLHAHFPDADVVTSVPISIEKKRVRGFNQAEVVAKRFAKLAKIPYQELLIKTDQQLKSQAKLTSKEERLQTTQQQHFHWKDLARAPTSVILIDDVYTTGTTLNSCAEILKKHGVKTVHGLVIAHGK